MSGRQDSNLHLLLGKQMLDFELLPHNPSTLPFFSEKFSAGRLGDLRVSAVCHPADMHNIATHSSTTVIYTIKKAFKL